MDEIDGSSCTGDAQREVILHTEFLVVCRGWNVEHIFDPVAAIGNLNFFPVRIRRFESAVPIHAEAQQVSVEAIFYAAIADYKASLKQTGAQLVGRWFENSPCRLLYKGDGVTLRIEKLEMLCAIRIFRDCTCGDAVCSKIAAHFAYIIGCKRHFGKKIGVGRSACGNDLDLLVVVYGKA